MKLTCRSCQHSIGSYPGSPLICTRNMQPVPAIPCDEFCYEPGTDEEETMEDVEEVPKSNGMWMLVEDAIALCDEAVAKEREACALHCDEMREQAVMSKYATQRDCQTARRAMEQCSAAIRMRSNA